MGSKPNGKGVSLRDRLKVSAASRKVEQVDGVPGLDYPVYLCKISALGAEEWHAAVQSSGPDGGVQRRKLLQHTLCDADGTVIYLDDEGLDELGALPNDAINFLFRRSLEFNEVLGPKAVEDAGKGSEPIPDGSSSTESAEISE